jgi:S-disulfanyl-L-cysteine oxidoreductase SoxD
MIRRSWATTALAAVAIAVGGGAVWRFAAKPPRIDPTDTAQVAAGEALYRTHCASCHGANLEGQPDWRTRLPSGRLPAPPHDANGHTWHHPDAVLLQIVREGPAFYAALGVQTDMPAFGTRLSEGDMVAVIAYIKSRWPAEIQARQSQANR